MPDKVTPAPPLTTSSNGVTRMVADWEQFLVNTRKLGYRDEKVEAVARECGYDRVQPEALVQVGWMLSPDLAAEFDLTPLSEEYLITLEQAEQDGGIKDEFANRVIPIYRKADDATHF